MGDPVPKEDTIEALLDYLVAPLLPIRDSELHHPTDQQHESVAKQMHAVVMLYNYYHRRNFPTLQFLGLESIRKRSCIAQPCLFAYLRHMHGFKEDHGNLNQQLSLTEKMVMDACNICIGLDSSKDTPNIETWPVSKVAVFLVDPTHNKCMLQYSSVTQGVWSLVEKVLEADSEKVGKRLTLNTLAFNKVTSNVSSGSESYQSEKVLEQLAFSAVHQLTGISHSDLSILEHHLTYSLSHEKTATLLYIMEYGRVGSDELSEVAIKDVLNSLEGPIVKRASTSGVEITSVVEYYDVLPYAEIISNWVSSPCPEPNSLTIMENQAMNDDLLNDQVEDNLRVEKGKLTTDKCDVKHSGTLGDVSSSKVFASEHLLVPASMPAIDFSHTTKRSGSNEQLNIKSNKILETETPLSNKNDLSSKNVLSCGVRSLEVADIVHTEEHAKNDKSFISAQTEDKIIGKNTEVGDSFMNGLSVNSCEDDSPSLNHHQLRRQIEDISVKNVSDSYIKMRNNPIPTELNFSFDGSGNKAGMLVLSKKACVLKCNDQIRTDVSNVIPDGTASDDLRLVPIQSDHNDLGTVYHVMKSRENDLMKGCLGVLQKRRDELYQRQRLLEDEIARCEMNIQAILTDGDKSTLKVESILEALNSLCSGVQVGKILPYQEQCPSQTTKRRKLTDALFSSKDACQELDEVCLMNSWMLPRYCVLPSFADCGINGKFEARVTVEGTDFVCNSGGDPKGSPQQARESAANHMLKKLKRMGGDE